MESVVFYMKDDLGMAYHDIAEELNRDDRTIWTVYNRALTKKVKKAGPAISSKFSGGERNEGS